jgi:uncharacterized protein
VDVRYSHAGLIFEWDRDKAMANTKKHGITFELACEVFFDPLLKIRDAGDPDEGTEVAIGESQDEQLLFVVHMIRHEEVIRIISARAATARERREYEEQNEQTSPIDEDRSAAHLEKAEQRPSHDDYQHPHP